MGAMPGKEEMRHLQIHAHWPDGHIQKLGYGMNWRQIRAQLRRQKKERPLCYFTINRIKPEARWVLNAYTYRMLRDYDRNLKREENRHKWKPW